MELYIDDHIEYIITNISMTHHYNNKKEVVCEKMSMYRSYLLKNNFWAKKGNEKNPGAEKVFIKHDTEVGGIYAIILNDKKGIKMMVEGKEYFFNNFDKLDSFLTRLQQRKDNFMKILRRKNISQRLRLLEI
ncbi:MAG: hypothetical protein ACW98X_22930 [Promethearchaeota archaeon]